MAVITINQNFQVEGFEGTILQIVKDNGFTISHSCLNGRCAECKVKVIEGEVLMPSHQEGLTMSEVNKGYCLSCIAKPIGDIAIEEVNYFEGVLPEVVNLPAKISKLEFLSKDIARLILRTPKNKTLKFLPGQYIDLSIKSIKRSYSIASTHSDLEIELLIKNHSGGQFSNYLFKEAKINDLLRIEGPKGTYIFPNDLPQNLLFISTGTGIAPNLSLIRSILQEGKIKKNRITLIHGQRTAMEHVYPIEDLRGIEIIKCTSRESNEGYKQGYVQDAVLGLNLNLSESIIFACGNPNMIKELKAHAIAKGLEEKNFKSDVFVASN